LRLCELDPESGATLSQAELAELRPTYAVPEACELAAADERLVLATADGILCCDRAGTANWLQRSTILPDSLRASLNAPPTKAALLVSANVVIALQPGAIGVQAFDLDSGRRIWQRAIPDPYQIFGAGDGLIVALTPRGLVGLQRATGVCAWSRPLAALPVVAFASADGHVAVGEFEQSESGTRKLLIRSLAPADGQELGAISVELPAPGLELSGPIASSAGRFFAIGRDRNQAMTHLLEFKPAP
jgi:hypothetical protein